MPQPATAVAITVAFALIGLLPLACRSLKGLALWVCLAAGVGAGFVAREAVSLAADFLAPYIPGIGTSSGATSTLALATLVGELLKALVPLIVIVSIPVTAPVGLALGAASGAGFGAVIIYQGLTMVLGLVGSPIITPASAILAVAGWFFRLLSHILTTAYVGRAAVRGGFLVALLVAWAIHVGLNLADLLPLLRGVPTGLVVTTLVSIGLYIYLWSVRRPAEARVPESP